MKHTFFLTQNSSSFQAARIFSGPENKSNRFPSRCTAIAYVFVSGNTSLATYAGLYIKWHFFKIVDLSYNFHDL